MSAPIELYIKDLYRNQDKKPPAPGQAAIHIPVDVDCNYVIPRILLMTLHFRKYVTIARNISMRIQGGLAPMSLSDVIVIEFGEFS